jgi:hypothetical protein
MQATTDRFSGAGTSANFASYLPLVYAGHPNRIQRYYQFDDMDRDSDINAALDTIADFSTLSEEHADEPFEFKYSGEPNESEVKILKQMMTKWVKLNQFRSRLWYMFRDVLKNGDAFFLRDPETNEWLWLDHFMVEMVKVDDTKGKKPDEYLIRGLDYNKQTQFGSKQADPNQYRTPYGTSNIGASRVSSVSASSGPAAFSLAGAASDPRQRHMLGPFSQEVSVVDAEHVVHLSLSIGNDVNWPFGTSILEPIFKVFKQKELLEDSIIIYRVQRAPERRIFYIDVGTMPPERAKRHIEMIKNDIHQRRIPNRTGTGGNILDAAYNPLCISLSTIIPLTDGRNLSLSDLITEYNDGKENWVYSCDPKTGEITKGPITWAGVTRQEAEVVCVMLDNGGAVMVTPDHKFPTLGGKLVQARDLLPEHELIARERFARTDKNGVLRKTGHGPEHMIVHALSVIEMQDKIDVGTITVDKEEIHNAFHNFAISENIFLQNSINDDYFFAQSCLRLNTAMHLLDGRTLTLSEIIDEHEQGKQNYVYSQSRETHDLEAGRITWAGITRRDAEMVRVTLDNDEYVDVTPDHRFILRDGTEKEAGNLKPMDSLMPLYLKEGRTGPKQKNAGYMRYVSNAKGTKTKFVHSTMCPKPVGRDWVVHHKDFDSENNNPDNLEIMTWDDHENLHKEVGTYSLNRQWNDPEAREKLKQGMRRLYDNGDEEFYKRLGDRNRVNGAGGNKKYVKRVAFEYSEKLFEMMVTIASANLFAKAKVAQILSNDGEFMGEFLRLNQSKTNSFGHAIDKVDIRRLDAISQFGGYYSWAELKESHNHKVVSVQLLTERADTGDITIESPSGSHIFALAAGVYVHNSDGRGSKVETLPGGEQTGEITDLMFFSRKLARGLRVPVSYLNLGEDDAGTGIAFNDGKLGAAMIQEFRFTKYCMRWQSLLAPVFDKDFKRYLVKNGIEMDWGLFELQFTPPQSFTRYRQIELDAQRVQVYQGVSENKKLAERFKLKRFLGLTEDEMLENEKLWSEENSTKLKKKTGSTPAEGEMTDGLSSVGVRPMGDDMSDMPPDMPEGDLGPDGVPMEGGQTPSAPMGGQGAPPAQ